MDRLTVTRRLVTGAAIVLVALVALSARLIAVERLPIDFDEDDYLRAGQQIATGLQAGDPGVVTRDNYRTEHPSLAKVVTGLAIAPLPPAPEIPDRPTTAPPADDLPEPLLTVARLTNAVFGVASAVLLAVVSPLGGLFLAVHTWTIKYTSQVMLESVPAFLALLAVVCASRAWRTSCAAGSARGSSPPPSRSGWPAGASTSTASRGSRSSSSGCGGRARPPGPTAARGRPAASPGGSPRSPAGSRSARSRSSPRIPTCGPTRSAASRNRSRYHGGYATSAAVQDTGWPSWQPLVWLMGSVPFHDAGTFPSPRIS